MVVRKGKKSEAIGEAHPFLNAVPMGQEPASTAYQYRKWDLGDNIKVVARCEVHGHETRKGKKTTFLSRAITEWDSKLAGNMDYRQKLESQSGAVLASEMKNNKNKLTRWTAEALISGVDEFKLGFVSRVNSKNNYEHDVLLVQRFKPTDFANMMQVREKALWGTLKAILEVLQPLKDGKYLLFKAPEQSKTNNEKPPCMVIYEIPADSFAHETGMGDEDE